ncbi:MAG: histidine phosphatase family protein [Anaerocolumna sp.]|jgi:alpha-ribazole phosphatase|nr:histidine phosphatase family protein [Anaerocolumna sp.]
MKIILIRHGQTEGNLYKRYIGSTDEALCINGINKLWDNTRMNCYPKVQQIYVSPMKRCIETAGIIYPNQKYITCNELRECDFGEFENKNYQELNQNKKYQDWLDSNGTLPFPGGETHEGFKERCIKGFQHILSHCSCDEIALIVHGGTIMSILDWYSNPNHEFYHWQIKNGEGYICELSKDKNYVTVITKIIGVGEQL